MKFVEIYLELLDHQPLSWRRLLVPKIGATLHHIHEAIQAGCGWTNSHLASFHNLDDEPVANLRTDDFGGDNLPIFAKVTLASMRKKHGDGFLYNYDYGDDWFCGVACRDVDVDAPARSTFVDGDGPWPPDDCGGIPGFEALLKTLAKRDKKKKLTANEKDLIDWLGNWRPDTSTNRLPVVPGPVPPALPRPNDN
jgi:hypothetical protein